MRNAECGLRILRGKLLRTHPSSIRNPKSAFRNQRFRNRRFRNLKHEGDNMAAIPQTYANHTRWHPPFHFFVMPVMLINFIISIVQFVLAPGWYQGWWIVFSLALVILALLTRINPLRAQDRIIRLEERLRYQQLLPADLARQTATLTHGQIIALRFASDDELEGRVRQVLEGQLTKPSEIKRTVENWRADTLRV
jgi:hypothetical protein